MKQTTCQDLRGACDLVITGETPEEMGEACKAHVMDMVAAGDQAHLDAVVSTKEVSEEEQKKWYEDVVAWFDMLDEV